MKKMMIALTALAAAAFADATYRVTFYQPSTINGTELKPGDYRVNVADNKAVIQQGKMKVEADVKVETADTKFAQTSVRYTGNEGKTRVSEIRIGGTTTKIVFNN